MMQIKVTEADIKNGIPRKIRSCPIALALKRRFPDSDIEVTRNVIVINDNSYWTNARIEKFIYAFDNGKSVKPFSFKIDRLITRGFDSRNA